MTLRQQKAFANIILHCSLTLSITKMHKGVAYWRLIDSASLSCRSANVDAVRELGLYSYRILYEIKSDNLIEVLAVIHKRQHLEAEEILGDQ